ncbi:hypothetical protein CCYA_CCYA05G1668 [Cyanidiococcus yangmingshanensis]|nr:hypothetical protein CCYA_CCYA05G1668 [Cyanidiococcus yangmingshanensis]
MNGVGTLGVTTIPDGSERVGAPSLQRFPKLRITRLTETECDLTLSDTDVSVANALRRIMIASVPTMSIDLVTVFVNDSPLHDEFIAHRLGLIPLRSDTAEYFNYNRDCDCTESRIAAMSGNPAETTNCEKCSVEFVLDVTCPLDGELEEMNVTSRHLRMDPRYFDGPAYVRAVGPVHRPDQRWDPNLDATREHAPGSEGIVICKLRRGQRLYVRCIAKKGTGREHAKWSPVAAASYRLDPNVRLDLAGINAVLTSEQKRLIVKMGEGALRLEANVVTGEVDIVEDEAYLRGRIAISNDCLRELQHALEEIGQNPFRFIVLNQSSDHDDQRNFYFSMESTGALPPEAIIQSSFRALIEKILSLVPSLREEAETHSIALGQDLSYLLLSFEQRRNQQERFQQAVYGNLAGGMTQAIGAQEPLTALPYGGVSSTPAMIAGGTTALYAQGQTGYTPRYTGGMAGLAAAVTPYANYANVANSGWATSGAAGTLRTPQYAAQGWPAGVGLDGQMSTFAPEQHGGSGEDLPPPPPPPPTAQ